MHEVVGRDQERRDVERFFGLLEDQETHPWP